MDLVEEKGESKLIKRDFTLEDKNNEEKVTLVFE
jgi:hypothetical protein